MFALMTYAFVYMLASSRNGTLYTGVTSNLETRIWQHKNDTFPGFSRKYGCKRLVWFECHDDIAEAILREKRIKRWRRAWKLDLIETGNPDWTDLYPGLLSIPPQSISPDSPLLGPG
jgi:putative endonuclease|tara:strand:- start:96 stop:446 length:351 start_codon:yes stop_codon:yes gene_type:complete